MSSPWVGGSKTPPYSVLAEKTLLGAIITKPETMKQVAAIVSGGDEFFRTQHGQIYEVMLAMSRKRKKPDMASLGDALTERGMLEAIGGQAFLDELAAGTTSRTDALDQARLIHDKAMLRQLIDAASDTLTEAYRGELAFDELLERARGRLDRLSDG